MKLTRKIRGTTYKIHVRNPDRVCKGVQRMEVDGRVVEGNRIPYLSNKETVEVVAVMGEA